jgi:hypothetical protein
MTGWEGDFIDVSSYGSHDVLGFVRPLLVAVLLETFSVACLFGTRIDWSCFVRNANRVLVREIPCLRFFLYLYPVASDKSFDITTSSEMGWMYVCITTHLL